MQIVCRLRRVAPLVLSLALAALLSQEAQAQDSARDLAQAAKRHLDAGRTAEALQTFLAAGKSLLEESRITGRRPDPQVADFLARHLYNLAVKSNNEGRAGEALDILTDVLEIRKARPELEAGGFRDQLRNAVLDIARYQLQAGEPEQSLRAYRAMDEAGGPDAEVKAGLGAALLASGRIEPAAEAFRAAIDLDRGSAEAAAGLGRVMRRAASEAIASRDHALARERMTAAVEWLGRARDLDPASGTRYRDLASALMDLRLVLAREGEAMAAEAVFGEAESAYRKAVELEPDSVWSRLDLASFLFGTRRYAEAGDLFERVQADLESLLVARPDDPNVRAWTAALESCRENRAAAGYNLAVDAINRAEFRQAERHLNRTCPISSLWEESCASLREAARRRESLLQEAVARHEKAASQGASRAADLLALGDLYSDIGAYDRALEFYRRLQALDPGAEGLEAKVHAASDMSGLAPRRLEIPVPGGRVDLVCYREELAPDLERAIKASWLRVSEALGDDALRGGLAITVYPNKRSFREQAGYRVGGLVRGFYGLGRVSIYETPAQKVLDWVSVLTHEMVHHAAERLSAGNVPRWLSEGIARYVEGDSTVIDRRRVAERLRGGNIPELSRLDDLMQRSWNDSLVILDARDAALLAVEEVARTSGIAGLRRVLVTMGKGAPAGRALVEVAGKDVELIDASWRERLPGN